MSKQNDSIAIAAIDLAQAIRHRDSTDQRRSLMYSSACRDVDTAMSILLDLIPRLPDDLCVDDVALIRHALGCDSSRRRRVGGYRNYYAPGGNAIARCERLAGSGHLVVGYAGYFHVTEKGAEAAGCLAEYRKYKRTR